MSVVCFRETTTTEEFLFQNKQLCICTCIWKFFLALEKMEKFLVYGEVLSIVYDVVCAFGMKILSLVPDHGIE